MKNHSQRLPAKNPVHGTPKAGFAFGGKFSHENDKTVFPGRTEHDSGIFRRTVGSGSGFPDEKPKNSPEMGIR